MLFEKIKNFFSQRFKSQIWFLGNSGEGYMSSTDIFNNHVIRTIINTVARQMAKLEVQHRDDKGIIKNSNVMRILGRRPNKLNNPSVFFHAIAVQLFQNSNALIHLPYDRYGEVTAANLLEYDQCKFYSHQDKIFLAVQHKSKITVYDYEDIVHLRIFYDGGVEGKSVTPDIQELVDLVHVSNEKLSKSVRKSGELNAYIKSEINLNKAKKDEMRDNFVNGLIEDGSGIAVLDGKAELKEVDIKYSFLTEEQLESIKKNLYSYFGISKDIIEGAFDEDKFAAFLEMIIEPIVMQAQQEFSYKWFTDKQQDAGNKIIFKTNRLRMASLANKGQYIETMVDKGVMSLNDGREIADMERYEDPKADEPRVPLDHAGISIANDYQVLKASESSRSSSNDKHLSIVRNEKQTVKTKEGETDNMKKMLLKFDLKAEDSDEKIAIIEGVANRSHVVDQGGDLTNDKTFVKTVQDRPKVPLLSGHNWDKCIGINELSLMPDGSLKSMLQINLETQEGKEQYSLAKQFMEQGVPYGLSIGYKVIREKRAENGVNVLEEVDVREVSLTPFPMNEQSTITAVKEESDIVKIRQNKIKKLLLIGA